MPAPEEIRAAGRQLAAVAGARTGLRVGERNEETLGRFVLGRLQDLGVSIDEYAALVRQGSPLSGELERLTRALTVGETYFFRGPAQFDVLRAHILPELVERRRAQAVLRLASAGCATGEEAYSLAILLHETVPELERWRASVLGVDVNTAALRQAAQGVYGEWSLRDVRELVRRRWFRREGKGWRLAPELRARARFHYTNLVIDPLPAPALGLVAMDLVLCRNVLFYFEPDVGARIAEKLARCLAPGGWLLFGSSDLSIGQVPGCDTIAFGEVAAFQRRPAAATSRSGAGSAISSTPPDGRVGADTGTGPTTTRAPLPEPTPLPRPATRTPTPTPVPRAGETSDAALRRAQALADGGDFSAAVAAFDAVLQAWPELARAHALHGFLLVELGSPEAGLDAFRRCLYLDPAMLLAHAGMALVGMRLGLHELWQRHAARVRALAAPLGDDVAVDGWEGMTAGRLLRLLEEQAPVADDEGEGARW
ncbi:MAG TPA: CheR family methyltransferase [Myxococcota bacterium]|jgi:chemotaxis protein methyltransferase CheR|nr:CheR family methyltransferase [Myxococcota bacterium]